jgi:hypothetical protein
MFSFKVNSFKNIYKAEKFFAVFCGGVSDKISLLYKEKGKLILQTN